MWFLLRYSTGERGLRRVGKGFNVSQAWSNQPQRGSPDRFQCQARSEGHPHLGWLDLADKTGCG